MIARPNCPDRPGRAGTRTGFTLAEVMIATTLVGIGITALMVGTTSSTKINAAGKGLTQATYLAQEVREWTLKLPFSDTDPGDKDSPPGPDGSDPQSFVDDLDDLMDVTYCPPRDGSGQAIAGVDGWSQHIALEWKDPDSLTSTVWPGLSDVVRVTVTISHHGRQVLTTGWLVWRRVSE